MSDLYLTRKIYTHKSTVGKLVMGDLELWTLEDTARMIKVNGETCIPSGVYQIEIRESPHFKRPLPHLLDVPFFEGVLIHSGNIPADTKGCILVGMKHEEENTISQSRDAFNLLFQKIQSSPTPLRIHIAGGYNKEEFVSKKKI